MQRGTAQRGIVAQRGLYRERPERKLQDYFTAGARLVWYIDPHTKSATVYTSPQDFATLVESDILTGGDVLPGFELPLRELFAEVDGK